MQWNDFIMASSWPKFDTTSLFEELSKKTYKSSEKQKGNDSSSVKRYD